MSIISGDDFQKHLLISLNGTNLLLRWSINYTYKTGVYNKSDARRVLPYTLFNCIDI
ncbi:hypothetical protein PDK11_27995 [Bacillus cereus]|nr:hypothetical protein [Bacillus cereus]